jgi:NADPH:quinone reductase-like Zn-dependent oxidoreductase
VQLAKNAGLRVIAIVSSRDIEYVKGLGAEKVLDYRGERLDGALRPVDAVIDTVGGEARERAAHVLGVKGTLVSVASPMPEEMVREYGKRAIFFLVEVTTARLNAMSQLFDSGKLRALVGTVLPLDAARTAHEMLAGAPHERGKIVLRTGIDSASR